MKILVIEDDRTTGTYIAEGLREEGHSVDLCTSGSDGLIQASVGQYDVLIVDRMLPVIDGVSAAVKLAIWSKHTQIARIF